jgi:hypothetical protein
MLAWLAAHEFDVVLVGAGLMFMILLMTISWRL